MTGLYVFLALVLVVLLGLWLTWTRTGSTGCTTASTWPGPPSTSSCSAARGSTLEVASTDVLDPASRLLLLDAAHRARNAPAEEFEAAESVLSEALRAVFTGPEDLREEHRDDGFAQLLDELAQDCAKVELARRFHNDVVVSARALRSRRRVRWLRLAGRAAELHTVDLDDVPPAGLAA